LSREQAHALETIEAQRRARIPLYRAHLPGGKAHPHEHALDYRTDLSDELCENAGVTFNREVMTLKEIKGELAKARKG